MDDDRTVAGTTSNEASTPPEHGGHQPEPLPRFGRSWLWLLIFAAMNVAGIFLYGMAYGAWLAATGTEVTASEFENVFAEHLMTPDGITGSYLVTAALVLAALWLASDFRQQPWQQTLALEAVPPRSYLPWILLLVVYYFAAAIYNMLVPVEPGDFVATIQGTRHFGLFVAMVVLAPVVEELLFRGYLYKAWRQSFPGRWGTLVLTSTLFALVHLGQYDFFLFWQLLAVGLLLGFAREKTGSVYVPIALHALNNLVSWFLIVYLGLY